MENTGKWYAVWIRTGQEERLLKLCNRRQNELERFPHIWEGEALPGGALPEDGKMAFFECFLPKYERAWRIKGKWEKREELLFPGYLFFITEYPDRLHRLLKTIPEFAKILGDDDGPIPLYEQEAEFLQKHTNQRHVFEMSMAEMIGQELIVTKGPLQDYKGKVLRIDRHRRTVVLEVEFFGRTVEMKVGMEVVKRT